MVEAELEESVTLIRFCLKAVNGRVSALTQSG